MPSLRTRENRGLGLGLSIRLVAVDDNADSRELLKVILERSSAEAAVVSSGQEARGNQDCPAGYSNL
jgi:hypothetical protein